MILFQPTTPESWCCTFGRLLFLLRHINVVLWNCHFGRVLWFLVRTPAVSAYEVPFIRDVSRTIAPYSLVSFSCVSAVPVFDTSCFRCNVQDLFYSSYLCFSMLVVSSRPLCPRYPRIFREYPLLRPMRIFSPWIIRKVSCNYSFVFVVYAAFLLDQSIPGIPGIGRKIWLRFCLA